MSYGKAHQATSIVSGPISNAQVPVFRWSTLDPAYSAGVLHPGQPDTWDFAYQTVDTPVARLAITGAPTCTCGGDGSNSGSSVGVSDSEWDRRKAAIAVIGSFIGAALVGFVAFAVIRRIKGGSGNDYEAVQDP
jgi:hypothetical protein